MTKYPQPPLGLAMIAAVLMENGYDVKILDLLALGLSEDILPEIVSKEKPDVVGITALTPAIDEAIKTAELVKKTDSNIQSFLAGLMVRYFQKRLCVALLQ